MIIILLAVKARQSMELKDVDKKVLEFNKAHGVVITTGLYITIVELLKTWIPQAKQEDIEILRKANAVILHFTIGIWIRNNCLRVDRELKEDLLTAGYSHIDDMSHAMILIWQAEIDELL